MYKTPPIQSLPVASKIWHVFPYDHSRVPRKNEINFDIDILLDTRPISIQSYILAQAELNELKK